MILHVFYPQFEVINLGQHILDSGCMQIGEILATLHLKVHSLLCAGSCVDHYGWHAVVEDTDPMGESQKQKASLIRLLSSPATWAIIVVNCVNHWGWVLDIHAI